MSLMSIPSELLPVDGVPESFSDDYSLSANERRHIERVLSVAKGNRAAAAKMLGMARQTLYNRLEEYGISGE